MHVSKGTQNKACTCCSSDFLFPQDLKTLVVEDLNPLSPEVISRQATINIGAALQHSRRAQHSRGAANDKGNCSSRSTAPSAGAAGSKPATAQYTSCCSRRSCDGLINLQGQLRRRGVHFPATRSKSSSCSLPRASLHALQSYSSEQSRLHSTATLQCMQGKLCGISATLIGLPASSSSSSMKGSADNVRCGLMLDGGQCMLLMVPPLTLLWAGSTGQEART